MYQYRKSLIFFLAISSLWIVSLGYSLELKAQTNQVLVAENFDDQAIEAPINVQGIFGGSWWYDSTECLSGSCLASNHVDGDMIVTLQSLGDYAGNGLYIRYWVKYAGDYFFPGDEGQFENVKMSKYAGGAANIEFIYKNSGGGGPSDLQLYWNRESTGACCGGTGSGETPLFPGANTDFAGNKYLTKGVWHKIEQYLKFADDGSIDGASAVHVQVDDSDVFNSIDADILLPAGLYSTTPQFVSIRAHDPPSDDHGNWFIDNVTIIASANNLVNNEPAEPGSVTTSATPVCGNGTVESGEQCDDGNTTSGDGCSDICLNETATAPMPEPPPAPAPEQNPPPEIILVSPCGGTSGLGGANIPDINSDGCVDETDLSTMLSCWGHTMATAPSSCLLNQ